MKLRTAPTILVVAIVAALVVPTGAIFGTMGADDLFDGEPAVEMAAHDGPNGEYVEAAGDGELEIDLSDPGVNSEAFTGVARVFDLVNTDTTNVTVWVTHDGDGVTLYDDATGEPIETEAGGVVLEPGEVVTVSIDVDSRNAAAGAELLSTVTLHAKYETPEFGVELGQLPGGVSEGQEVTVDATVANTGELTGETTVEFLVDGAVVDSQTVTLAPGERRTIAFTFEAGGDDATVSVRAGDAAAEGTVTVAAPGGAGGGGAADETPDEDQEEEQAPETEEPVQDEDTGVEVVFEEDAEGGDSDDAGDGEDAPPQMTVREMDVSELDTEDTDRPPRAVISSGTAETDGGGQAGDEDGDASGTDSGPNAEAFDTMTVVDEPTELSGERSTIGSAAAVTSRDRITQVVDIQVPPERENRPATVRMRVDRDRLGDVEGERTMIGHRTDGGWELLETRVVDRTDEQIVVEARTPGFSPFAVFSPPNVTYEWTLPNGTVLEGPQIDPTFEEPGIYGVQLTVTDALGRQSTTTHRVLANDVPEATIEVLDREGDQVTLAANVTDEFGETTVTWTFPDGTQATGEEVTHTLEEGEHEIGLRVVDEYGAEFEGEQTVAVGPPGAAAEMVADAVGMDLELLVQVGLLSVVGLVVGAGYQRIPWGIFAFRRRGPEINIVGSPVVDADAGRIEIESLTVRDPTSALETVTVEVDDEAGTTVVRKRLDMSGVTEYAAEPETLVVPPGTELRPEVTYTIRIEAAGANGRNAGRYTATTVNPITDPDAGVDADRSDGTTAL